MFSGLWPGFDVAEVPITSVTNGVHAPTWVAPELVELVAGSADPLPAAAGRDGPRPWSVADPADDPTFWDRAASDPARIWAAAAAAAGQAGGGGQAAAACILAAARRV